MYKFESKVWFECSLNARAQPGPEGGEPHGILEGISSLHSWIKTQTMIRPNQRGGRGGKQGAIYDEVSALTSGLCNT